MASLGRVASAQTGTPSVGCWSIATLSTSSASWAEWASLSVSAASDILAESPSRVLVASQLCPALLARIDLQTSYENNSQVKCYFCPRKGSTNFTNCSYFDAQKREMLIFQKQILREINTLHFHTPETIMISNFLCSEHNIIHSYDALYNCRCYFKNNFLKNICWKALTKWNFHFLWPLFFVFQKIFFSKWVSTFMVVLFH